MKQEDKELLIKDLCARLFYKPKAIIENKIVTIRTIEINPKNDEIVHVECFYNHRYFYKSLEDIKLCLIPLSLITNAQEQELSNISDNTLVYEDGIIESAIEDCVPYDKPAYVTHETFLKVIDWLNKNHFDYRGLIDKGLAIDTTNLKFY